MISYKIQSEITLPKYIDMSDHPLGKKAKKKLNTWKGLNCLGMVMMSANTYFCFKSGEKSIGVISAAFVFLFAFKLIFQRKILNKKNYGTIISNYNTDKWIRTITFSDVIEVADNNSTTKFKYSDYKYATETDKYFLLWKNEDVVLRVEKDSFVLGDPDKFLKWINNKLQ